jgi:hypothetical protein
MLLVSGLAGTIAIGIALQQGQGQAHAPEKPLAVSFCEVKANPEKFLHKLVEVTATASHGFEDSMVDDSRGPWPNSGPGVWMEYGGTRSTDTMYCCGFSPKPDREQPLVVDGMPLEWWMIRHSKSLTSNYIQSIQSHNEGPTLSELRCEVEYLLDTRALWEHSRGPLGGDMVTWTAACSLS